MSHSSRIAVLTAPLLLALAGSLLGGQDSPVPVAKPTKVAGKTQTVIAEGVGLMPDLALADAFRNAVRQVVGAVVDAETLVKNDKLISDKVLTYSDGFITSYKKLSEATKDGLHRVKISAEVERRSVVAKLQASDVGVKELDGEGLFAEVKTQNEAAKNARALMENALKDYPFGCLEGQIVGKPRILEKDDAKVKFHVDIAFRVNHKAYQTALARLHTTIRRIALNGGQFGYVGRPDNIAGPAGYFSGPGVGVPSSTWPHTMPKVFPKQGEETKYVVIALTTQINPPGDRSLWNYYILDESIREPLTKLAKARPHAKVSLLDKESKLVAEEELLLCDLQVLPINDKLPYYERFFQYNINLLTPIQSSGTIPTGVDRTSLDGTDRQCSCFLFSPFFFTRNNGQGSYRLVVPYSQEFTLTLDEVQRIRRIECKILFE